LFLVCEASLGKLGYDIRGPVADADTGDINPLIWGDFSRLSENQFRRQRRGSASYQYGFEE
jgi:hypothetical protein